MQVPPSKTTAERVTEMYRLSAARHPKTAAVEEVVQLYEDLFEKYQADGEAARRLLADEIEATNGELPDAARRAAWTMVANMLLNLDETFMK